MMISCKKSSFLRRTFCMLCRRYYELKLKKICKTKSWWDYIICLLHRISIFFDQSHWRKLRKMIFRFLSRLRKSVVSWWYMYPYSHVLAVHEVIMRINWLKGICFPKMREIVELILCETSGAIPVICMRKESFVFSINL